jgi:hypothetical protein
MHESPEIMRIACTVWSAGLSPGNGLPTLGSSDLLTITRHCERSAAIS